jgi:hypothetical protein
MLLAFCASSYAQKTSPKTEITGIVLDSVNHKPMRMASVSLLTARDSAYVTATITDGDGRFRLRNVATGAYRLLVTFVGYRNASKIITANAAQQTDAGTISLTEQGNTLNEVVIRQESAPVTIKQDTLEFNASSFKTQPNAQVEELLRKLPGVEVARDGSIKANGQSVSKVLVDGKPFFGNDPKMATRNLPADIVDKVQLYDQSSDQSQFSGMDDGNRERTINITIKKDKGKGYFGQNALGAGPSPGENSTRYQARLNVNRFNNRNGGPVRQLSVIGQANNLNQQNFTMSGGNLPGPGSGGPQLVGDPGGGQDNGQAPSNIVEVKAAGINFRNESAKVRWGKRTEMAASYFANQTITTTDQESRRENIVPGRSFITDQSSFSKNSMTSHRFNGRFDMPLDSMTSLRLTPNISFQNQDFNNRLRSYAYRLPNDSLNAGKTDYDLNGNGLSAYNNLLLMRKFQKEGRSFSANLNTTLTNGRTTAYNNSLNTFYDSLAANPSVDQLQQRARQNHETLQNTLSLSFTEPLSLSQKLEFRYAYSRNFNKLLRDVFDKNQETDSYDQPNSLLTNDFNSKFETNRLGSSFQNRRLRYSFTIGLDMQLASLRPHNQTDDSHYRRNYGYLMPNALFTYTFSGNKNLRFQYRTRVTSPGINQLSPVPDNSNPLNISMGNPTLRPEYYHTLSLTYSASARAGADNLYASAFLNQSDNRISQSTATDETGVQVTKPVNTKGFWSANGFLSLSKKIQLLRLTVNLTTNANFARNTSFVNALGNSVKNTMLGQGVRVQSDFNGKLDYGISGRVTFQDARYTLLPQQNSRYWSQYATADVHWQLPGNFVVTTDVTYTGTTGRAAGYNQRFTLWNAALTHQFLKTKQGEIRLQVFDILNQNRSLVRNTGDSYIEDVRSKVLKRYFLISLVYNLRKFGV